jgi:hypothetical protein
MRISCPHCGRKGQISSQRRSRQVRCPSCGEGFWPEDGEPERSSFRCPFCQSAARPEVRQKVAAGGWVLFGVLLCLFVGTSAFGILCVPFCFSIFLAPLSLLGLLIKDDVRVCSSCGIKLG